jgi:hypothetical protein
MKLTMLNRLTQCGGNLARYAYRHGRAVALVPTAVLSVVRGVLSMEIAYKRRPQSQAVAAQFLLGIAGLALITFICFRLGFGLARTGFAYCNCASRWFRCSAASPSRSFYRSSPQPA